MHCTRGIEFRMRIGWRAQARIESPLDFGVFMSYLVLIGGGAFEDSSASGSESEKPASMG